MLEKDSAHRAGGEGSVLSSPGDPDAALREAAPVAGCGSPASWRKRSSNRPTAARARVTSLPACLSVAAGRCPLCAGAFSQLSNQTWQAGLVGAQTRAPRPVSRCFGNLASGGAPEGAVSVARLPVVGCVGFDFLVAGERPGAGGALGRNLPSAPPVGQTTVPGEERMDVGDDLADRA